MVGLQSRSKYGAAASAPNLKSSSLEKESIDEMPQIWNSIFSIIKLVYYM